PFHLIKLANTRLDEVRRRGTTEHPWSQRQGWGSPLSHPATPDYGQGETHRGCQRQTYSPT
ncbi:transposase, partial [Acidithrix ferrooxidans]|uniref:transposase n=1 Tax=Acidithrix ferrooxidans TaxID=1280514 RepID=UPI001F1FA951